MSLSEHQGLSGVLTIELRDAGGAIIDHRRVHNLITKGGKKLLADLLLGKVDALPTAWSIAVGTGTEQEKPADDKLIAQIDKASDSAPRVELVEQGGVTVIRATVVAKLPERTQGSIQKLTEAGILIVSKPGDPPTLFNRVTFAEVNRGTNMAMTLTWEITF